MTIHHLTLSLLLTAGPLRIACHATVGDADRARPAETCSVDAREAEGDEEDPSRNACTPPSRAMELRERPG